MNYTNIAKNEDITESGLIFEIGSLLTYFMQVSDSRKAKGKQYALEVLLTLMMLAKLCGENKPSGIADWASLRVKELYKMKILAQEQTPSHMTYRRVLQDNVRPEEFELLVSEYQQSRCKEGQEVIFSMDGKTLKGTIPQGETRGTHLLSIYVPNQGLVLAEAQVDRKENEIVVAPKILKQVNLSGAIVIGDAMHAQREVSKQIVEAGGDFIWTIKGNQARTEWAIKKLFAHEIYNLNRGAPLSKHCQIASCIQKGHGRIEKRTIVVSTELNDYLDWPYIAQVFRIEREIWDTQFKRRTSHVVFGLTSLAPQKASAKNLLRFTREYWGIENGLHYRRDVTLQEDATLLSVGNSGQNMAILNNLVVCLCIQAGYTNLAKARRIFAAQPDQALNLMTSA